LRPGWQGQSLQGQRFIFLVDNSASMNATDTPSGRSRLDEAKDRVAALVNQLGSGMSAMIISFGKEPEVVQEFTDDRRQLHEALDRIRPTASQTDLSGALKLADGFANPGRAATESTEDTEAEVSEQARDVQLYICSDGRFRDVEDFSLGTLRPKFLPVGSFEANNLAITALNARRSEERPELQQAFVQVANFSDADERAVVELYLNDQLVDATELSVPARDIASTTFALGDSAEGELRAQLDPPRDFRDQLVLDNRAYAVLEDRRNGRVLLVTPGNATLEAALTTERAQRLASVKVITPDALETPEFKRQWQLENYDLVIFDQCVPDSMPLANTVFVGRLPPLESWKQSETAGKVNGPQIIDWERSHPLLSLVELAGVQIVDSLIVRPPAGGRVLVDSTSGPLAAIAPRDRYEDVVLGFEIVGRDADGVRTFNTDWPRKHSFPSFWLNVLEYFAGGETGSLTFKPEQSLELRVNSTADHLQVQLPDGQVRQVKLDQPGRLAFHETNELGNYQVLDSGQVVKRFAVNLFDRDESDIRLRARQDDEDVVKVVDSISIGFVDVAAQPPTSAVRRELWKPLLLGALVVLFLEWYIYNRRVYV
jgi:von Willebrand factor type A domain